MGIFLMIVGSLAVWLTIGVLSAKLVFILRKRQLTRIRDLSGYNELFRWVMKDAPV